MAKYNWTRQETKDLITLYEVNDCLWNKSLREYKDRDERVSSIQSIADEMRISIEEINKKIHNLRNQYRFELNKSKKKIPGKPTYVSKWPYYNNLNFLENIVSVRGAHPQNNNNSINNNQNEDDGTSEAKYEEVYDANNYSDKFNNNETLVALQNVPAVITVEYEDIKPAVAVKVDIPVAQANTRKRKLQKVEVAPQTTQEARMSPQQQQFMNYVTHQIQMQQVASSSPKLIPTIAVDDNRQMVIQQLHQNGVVIDVDEPKNNLSVDEEESKAKIAKDEPGVKYDSFEIFGLFVANELRGLTSTALKKKLKRKILELVLDVTEEDAKFK